MLYLTTAQYQNCLYTVNDANFNVKLLNYFNYSYFNILLCLKFANKCFFLPLAAFTMLYVVPTAALAVCLGYEQAQRPQWTQRWQETVCREPVFRSKWQTPCRYPDQHGDSLAAMGASPMFHLRMAEIFCMLLGGSVSSFWVLRARTVAAWKELAAKLTGKGDGSATTAAYV